MFLGQLYESVDRETINFEFKYFNGDNIYKEMVCRDYLQGEYEKEDEQDVCRFNKKLQPRIKRIRMNKDEVISLNFYYTYLKTLTFDYFKTLLYDNGIYNDIFADEAVIDLK